MPNHSVVTLTGLGYLAPRRLARIRVRLRVATANGEVSTTTSVDRNGQVLLPRGVSKDARITGATVVDVKGPDLQPLDLTERAVEDLLRDGPLPSIELSDAVLDVLRQDVAPVLHWTRSGRFAVLGRADASFSGFELFVSPVTSAEAEAAFRAVKGPGERPTAFAGRAPLRLTGIPQHAFKAGQLSFDGRFDFSLSIRDDIVGWIWVLSGKTTLVGFRIDDLPVKSETGITILLSADLLGGSLANERVESESPADPRAGGATPLAASEQELLDHPELFSDDPGPFCEPFKNPERILGERRFMTILRVEQPDIAAASGIRAKAMAGRLQAAGEDLLHAGGDRPGVEDLASAFNRPRRPIRDLVNVADAFDPVGPAGGRQAPGSGTLIDWEGDTSQNQAVSVAGGHILEWRVRWRSNGYSLGNVNHTLTLAPRQIKRIVKIDFARRESAVRREELRLEDEVQQTTEASRDYRDAVRSSLSEWMKGSSTSKATGFSAGVGQTASASAPVAPGVVVSGGSAFGAGFTHGAGRSDASQSGGRRVAATEEQNLRDAIRQFGESLRDFESTVITEVNQEETVEGVSELIANPNFCHALTVVYYDILRHLRVDTELGGVSECLFVPFAILPFTSPRGDGEGIGIDYSRVLAHADVIEDVLRDPSLKWVFRYLRDFVENGNDGLPEGARKEQLLTSLRGVVEVEMHVASPLNGDEDAEVSFDEAVADSARRVAELTRKIADKLLPFPKLRRRVARIAGKLAPLKPAEREESFQRDEAPGLARYLTERLRLKASNGTDIGADFTLDGTYVSGRTHKVYFSVSPSSLRAHGITRQRIETMSVVLEPEPLPMPLGVSFADADLAVARPVLVPATSYMNVVGARISFRTEHYERGARYLVESSTTC